MGGTANHLRPLEIYDNVLIFGMMFLCLCSEERLAHNFLLSYCLCVIEAPRFYSLYRRSWRVFVFQSLEEFDLVLERSVPRLRKCLGLMCFILFIERLTADSISLIGPFRLSVSSRFSFGKLYYVCICFKECVLFVLSKLLALNHRQYSLIFLISVVSSTFSFYFRSFFLSLYRSDQRFVYFTWQFLKNFSGLY